MSRVSDIVKTFGQILVKMVKIWVFFGRLRYFAEVVFLFIFSVLPKDKGFQKQDL